MRKGLLRLQVGLIKDGITFGVLESTQFNQECKEGTGCRRARVNL